MVGEDLGTVPDGFRERMEAGGILSYRLFYFERWESGLSARPETYPALALATAALIFAEAAAAFTPLVA